MDRNEKEIQCIGPKPFRKNKNKTNKKRKKKKNPFLEVKMRTLSNHTLRQNYPISIFKKIIMIMEIICYCTHMYYLSS